ncbi:MAG: LPS export ABC transporter permease LptG [Alphaproteobacteria bacterium]|nr:LPS export ABC transporter permease LptG [Alphaproteobacteria bacterium]
MTLAFYYARQFAGWVAAVFFGIMAIVFIGDFVEMLRRASDKDAVGITDVIELTLLKQANMAQIVLPFVILFAGLLCLSRLTRTNELVVSRAAGLSAWRFLLPALVVALLLGGFRVAVFNPVASVMTERFELLENRLLGNRGSFLSLSETGLWVRQSTEDGTAIIHASQIAQEQNQFLDMIAFRFNEAGDFIGRIDARFGELSEGQWLFTDVLLQMENGRPTALERFALPTNLTLDNLQDSFAAPETMSFWELPEFIEVLEQAGFSAQRHRLHFHAMLASPLLLCAMVLIAAAFSLRMTRRGGALGVAAGGIAAGFLTYFVSDLVFALGLSGRIPVELAAWAPATVATLLGAAVIFHLEDG